MNLFSPPFYFFGVEWAVGYFKMKQEAVLPARGASSLFFSLARMPCTTAMAC